jgi:hypothetical protein
MGPVSKITLARRRIVGGGFVDPGQRSKYDFGPARFKRSTLEKCAFKIFCTGAPPVPIARLMVQLYVVVTMKDRREHLVTRLLEPSPR